MIFQPNLVASVFDPTEPGVFGNPLPYVTHYVGIHRYPLTASHRSSVYLAHYNGKHEPFSGPVKKITFLHVGSPESPNMFAYSRTCSAIEFSGHLASTSAMFGTIAQLPELSKVTINVGSSQQHYFPELYSKVGVCPSVKRLKISMDLDYFYSFQHFDCSSGSSPQCNNGKCLSSMQYSLLYLVESLLIHAKDCFPNLKNLTVELPENDILCKMVQSLIQSCPGLRKKTQAALQQVLPNEEEQNSERPRIRSHSGRSWFQSDFYSGPQMRQQHVGRFDFSDHDQSQNQPAHCPSFMLPYLTFNHNGSASNGSTFPSLPNYFPSGPARFPLVDDARSTFETRMDSNPPPGFSPLPIIHVHQEEDIEVDVNRRELYNLVKQNESYQQQDVNQRVNSWLSSMEI